MVKDVQINFKIESELKRRLLEYTREHKYDDYSTVIREAIEEKLNSESEEERIKKVVEKLLQDPDRRRNLRLK